MVVDFFNNEIKEGQIVIRAISSNLCFHKVVGITSGDNLYLNRVSKTWGYVSSNGKLRYYNDNPSNFEEAINPEKEGKKLFYKVWHNATIASVVVSRAPGLIVYKQPEEIKI